MRGTRCRSTAAALLVPAVLCLAVASAAKEFLTPREIEKIQEAQEIDKRAKIYVEAAALRLKSAEERLSGKESEPGDPLEFFTVEDMLDGYYQIVRAVMFNVDDAFQKPGTDKGQLRKALKTLQEGTKKAEQDLQVLKKLAEEKRREQVWNLARQALDITLGAREGAESGLAQIKE